MTTPSLPSLLPHLWKSAAASGLLAIAFGVAIVAWPAISVLIAAIFFGACLLINGIQQVVFAFSLHVSAGGRVLLFISGAVSLILAIMAFRHVGDAVLLLAIWIGIGFIFRGVATTVSAISDPTLPGRGWNVFVGVISLIAGIAVLASPFDSIATLALVVGIWSIAIGLMEVVSAYAIRKAMHSVHPTATGAITRESVDPTTEAAESTAATAPETATETATETIPETTAGAKTESTST